MTHQTINVWDPVVRLFHWSLALSFAMAWLSADRWDNIHEVTGYIAAALIGIRVIWGFIGSHYARFAQFVRKPADTLLFIRQQVRKQEPRYIGHNPMGALMIVALIIIMGITSLTGWMYTTDKFWGVSWVETVHEFGAELLVVLVVLHVAGVIYASLAHHENLVKSMLSGKKRAAQSDDIV